ncbi:MAG: DUF4234 domain-containing protein [Candidatus Electrothrix sp. AR1]|nr:DUF4234 domain-containing protein [Candidatus Electrothrix sp. AR1]
MSTSNNITQTGQDKQPTDDILKFKKKSACLVWILDSITQGFYIPYWMNKRIKIINEINKDKDKNKINMYWLHTMMISVVAFILATVSLMFIDEESYLSSTIAITMLLAYITAIVSYFILIFKIKNRIKNIINNSSETEHSISNILTLLLGNIYIQYKINKCIDDIILTKIKKI